MVWAGLWNKRVWADYEQLLRPVFSLFWGQNFFIKFFWKNHSVRTEKLHRKKVKKKYFFWGRFFFFHKTLFVLGLKFEWNLSVNTERSGPDYCWLYCGTNRISQDQFSEGIFNIINFVHFLKVGQNLCHFYKLQLDLKKRGICLFKILRKLSKSPKQLRCSWNCTTHVNFGSFKKLFKSIHFWKSVLTLWKKGPYSWYQLC